MNNCKCTLSQSILGDGCEQCNPEMHVEILKDRIELLEAFVEGNDLNDLLEVWEDEVL